MSVLLGTCRRPGITTEGNAYIERVIDGDTVVLGDGSKVRLIGIDAPESDAPCGDRATDAMRQMVEKRNVTLTNPSSVRDKDKYGRLLRYIDTEIDPAAALLTNGLATARYDSTDGYQTHPRQPRYHALEAAAVAACPTLDRNSRWYDDPDGYRDHREKQRIAKETLEQKARAERRKERARREAARREAEQREYERMIEEIERESQESGDYERSDSNYNGPRCYAPGGKTWTPC